jgi:hypothetical protein
VNDAPLLSELLDTSCGFPRSSRCSTKRLSEGATSSSSASLPTRLSARPTAFADGTETFKLIGTARAEGSGVEGLLARALAGLGVRDVARQTSSSTDDAWTTVTRSFTLRRAET